MRPRRRVETCQESLLAQRNGKATFCSPSDEKVLPAASTIKPEEREFVVDSGASMHLVSRKDLTSADLETGRISKKSDDAGSTLQRGANKRRGNSVCLGVGFLRDSKFFLRTDRQFFHSENSAKIRGKITCGQKPHLIKNGRKIDCNTVNYVPFVAPGLLTSSSTSSSPPPPTSSSEESVAPTEHPASTRSESVSEEQQGNLSHGPAETETLTKKDDNEQVRGNLSPDLPEWLQESRHMNYPQSREQKWHRVNAVFILLSRRTEIAISA